MESTCHIRSTCHVKSARHVRSTTHIKSAHHVRSTRHIKSARHVRSTCHIRSMCHVKSAHHVRSIHHIKSADHVRSTRYVRSTRHFRSVCNVRSTHHIRSADDVIRCSALIWTELPLQYLSWGSLSISWLVRGRVGAEEMAPWVRKGPCCTSARAWVYTWKAGCAHFSLSSWPGETDWRICGACWPCWVKRVGPQVQWEALSQGTKMEVASSGTCTGLHMHTQQSTGGSPVDFAHDFFAQDIFHFLVRSDQLRLIVEVWTMCEANTGIPGWMLTQLHGLHVWHGL